MLEIDPSPASRKGKNILIFCDGTGNKFIDDSEAHGSNSNVVKLYSTMKIDSEQVAYYHPGVGTAGDPSAKSWLARQWSVVKGLAFAWGFKDNVLDAYRYLMETYKDGDRVYMFGFSRGSYTVRALGGLLDGYGLLCKGNEGHLPYAWNEYVGQHDDRKLHHVEPNKRFKETFAHKNFRIHFMGIWDTVSSVGWVTTPLRLYSVAHNPIIDIGRHAISIDEHRCFYRDNLWTGADRSLLIKHPLSANLPQPGQDLLQLWFAGVHSDIGGSYPRKECVLSNIALDWLMREATKAGAATLPEMRELVMGVTVPPTGDPLLDQKIEDLKSLYERPVESKVHKSLRGLWWLLELLPHRYYDKDDGKENWRTPLGMRRRIPRGAFIHSSVKERMKEHADYKPKNLQGGAAALQEIDVPGQDPRSVYVYEPATDSQPILNKAVMRVAVMVLVSLLDLAFVVVALAIVGGIGCWVWHHWILWVWHCPILWMWHHWMLPAWHCWVLPVWNCLHRWVSTICAA
jgi:uncharacterized protein (DUF2235 family)